MAQSEGKLSLKRSMELGEEASAYCPLGVPTGKWWAPRPFYVAKAKGSRIWDMDGNEYLDYWCGAGPLILGNAHPEVVQAAMDAIQLGNVQFALPHEKDVALAKKLTEYIPCAEKVALCVTGTDATGFAVRVARAYTGKTKVAKFDGGYQGWSDTIAVNYDPSTYGSNPKAVHESAGVPPEAIANTIVLPYNDIEGVATRLRQEKDKVACVVVEPMIHSSNLLPKAGFLEGLRQLCNELGVVLAFDEIVTGFRHGLSGGQGVVGVTPDIGAFGKAMASGYVIAAVCGKKALMSLVAPEGNVKIAGTFSGNALASSVALKTLEVLSRPGFYPQLFRKGERLRGEINEAIQRMRLKARCDGFGSVWCMYFSERQPQNQEDVVAYQKSGGAEMDNAYRQYLLENRVFIRPQTVNRAYISAAHTDEDIARTVEVTVEFLEKNAARLR